MNEKCLSRMNSVKPKNQALSVEEVEDIQSEKETNKGKAGAFLVVVQLADGNVFLIASNGRQVEFRLVPKSSEYDAMNEIGQLLDLHHTNPIFTVDTQGLVMQNLTQIALSDYLPMTNTVTLDSWSEFANNGDKQ